MGKHLEFYYDFGSPNVYLAYRALSRVEGLSLDLKPALIGGLFKAANNQPPWQAFGTIPTKMQYMQVEIARFVEMYDLPDYRFNPHFPVMTILPMRTAMVALDEGTHDQFFEPVLSAMWEEGKDISLPPVLADVLDDAGLEGERMVARTQEQGIKDALKEVTTAASMRGLFGLPSWFDTTPASGGEPLLYFGKDCCWMMGAKPIRMP
jgi:2-hydroxychromene-2-carboxylate isomerase